MGLDSNGIWQYTEGESAAPFSNMLNRLAASVSGVVGPYVPHANATLTLAGGLTNLITTAWRRGPLAGIEIECRIGTAVSGATVGTLAAVYRPTRPVTVTLTPNKTDPASAFIQVNTVGGLTLSMFGVTDDLTILRGSACWPATT